MAKKGFSDIRVEYEAALPDYRLRLSWGWGEGIKVNSLRELEAVKADGLRAAVACAADPEVLASVKLGREIGLSFTLVGPEEAIRAMARAEGLADGEYDLAPADDPGTAAKVAVGLVRGGEAQILMKGAVGTADLLRPVLDREAGLRTGGLLSYVALVELPGPRLVLITDAGINIAPGLPEKAEILRNAARTARRLGFDRPRAAVLSAVEQVNPAIPGSLEAAALAKMADRGQLGEIVVDGPLALDNAVSPHAAATKGLAGAVAGAADILLVPEIVCGNVLYKALVHLGGFPAAGCVAGASAPIVLTSRADDRAIKLNSLRLAVRLCADRS